MLKTDEAPANTQDIDLVVVMPVYNEVGCIEAVLHSWLTQLRGLGMPFCILVLDDGSTDGTPTVLHNFVGETEIQVISKANSGHGPTILEGYCRGVAQADWVLQVDSDGEISPEEFGLLWEKRKEYDALFGIRSGRVQTLDRKIISAVSRGLTRLLYGRGIADVNVPFRLMRSSMLAPVLAKIPPDTLAPNIVISGMMVKRNVRVFQTPVSHENRTTGVSSIRNYKLLFFAARAFFQTVRLVFQAETENFPRKS